MSNNQLSIRDDLRNTHLWCGIAAAAAALRITTSEALDLLKATSLRRAIKAVTYSELRHALAYMIGGDKLTSRQYPREATECPTLSEWLEAEYRESNRTYVICITGHWITIRNDEWVCSMSHKPRSVSDCPYLRARVRFVTSFMDERS